ncbi:hypothetical protein [Alcaligenes faecalis]|uniref:hypothetical protein n=1 Tax=Alcaligenes faecalis TaxID=511 RepID=UPI00208FC8F2|nr:hypothetical protein [Alcaligenes faecalis]USP49521.1 hypothetical protein J5J84_08620 [Alcaligenes faecalis]
MSFENVFGMSEDEFVEAVSELAFQQLKLDDVVDSVKNEISVSDFFKACEAAGISDLEIRWAGLRTLSERGLMVFSEETLQWLALDDVVADVESEISVSDFLKECEKVGINDVECCKAGLLALVERGLLREDNLMKQQIKAEELINNVDTPLCEEQFVAKFAAAGVTDSEVLDNALDWLSVCGLLTQQTH